MAQAEITEVVSVSKDKFFDAVVGYEEYPKFVEGCTKVAVERKAPGRARVTYFVSMLKDIQYTLDHVEDRDAGTITWSLISSDTLKANTGKWTITAMGENQCKVSYTIDIEFKVWVPGPVLSKLVKSSLPTMLKGFSKKAGA